MTGKIMKGIGGFYYVYVEGSGLYECRARGIFRNKKMKPNVGDVVDIDILSEEEKTGSGCGCSQKRTSFKTTSGNRLQPGRV